MKSDDAGRPAVTPRRGGLSRRELLVAMAALPVPVLVGCQSPPPAVQPAPVGPAPAAPESPSPVTRSSATVGRAAVELTHASSGRPEVALTFHGAGDPELARKILTEFADRGAGVTVLAVGTWIEQFPDTVKMITDHGHEIGNHTWSHPNLARLDRPGVRAEIERCRDRLVALTGNPGAFFRPSAAQHATAQVRELAGAAGYPTVLSYDVDSRDFTDPGPAAIRRNVRAAAAGSVVSLHLGHPQTLEAIPGLLDDLHARGLSPVTASRLFG